MDWREGVTLGIALLGAVLGVINTVWALYRDRARLKVVAVWMGDVMPIAGSRKLATVTSEFEDGFLRNPNGRFGVRVTNLGFVEVTIDSVGVTKSGFFKRIRKRHIQRSTIISDALGAVELPHRLLPRESITVWSSLESSALQRVMKPARRVYASTSCGLNVFGNSHLLRSLVRHANSDDSTDQQGE